MSKVLSGTFNDLEEGIERQPSEIYHFWCGSNHWYYTSLEERILFMENYYEPTSINRGTVEYRTDLNVSQLTINLGSISQPVIQYIAKNPVDIVWVQVSRLFMDNDDDEAAVIFIGQIKTPSFRGQKSSIDCVGFEHFLMQLIPKERYQPQCNYNVFDDNCGLDDSGYKLSSITVTVDSTKRILTATEFDGEEDGYWVFGHIEYDSHRRMILLHQNSVITLAYPLWTMPSGGGEVDVWPGCDRSVTMCRDKFDNVSKALAFPDMPFDNPALWT